MATQGVFPLQILTVFPPLYFQCVLLDPALNSTLSSVLRALLVIPITYLTSAVSYQFHPLESSRIINCVIGVATFYASWKGLEYGLVRDRSQYEWVGFSEEKKNDGETKDSWKGTTRKPLGKPRHSALHLLTSMRGHGYRFGPKKYPPQQTTRQFLLANSSRFALTHVLSLACGIVLSTPRHAIAELISTRLSTSPTISLSIAGFAQSLALGTEAFAALSLGYTTISLIAFVFATLAHRLLPNRFAPFDSREYTPIINSPWAIDSVTVFWKSRWHSLFRRSFVWLSFPFGSRGLLRRIAGTMNVFLLSSILHQQAIYSALHRLPAKSPPLSLVVEHGGSIYFLSQGAAILFEALFAKVVGRRRIESFRILGLLFGYAVVAGMGGYLADSWFSQGVFDNMLPVEEWSWGRILLPNAWLLPPYMI